MAKSRRYAPKAARRPPFLRRPQAPLPDCLPGRFFVIEKRPGNSFRIVLDDEERSSFILPVDRSLLLARFRVWNVLDVASRAFDVANESGAAQGILRDGRVIPIHPRPKPALVFRDHERSSNAAAFF